MLHYGRPGILAMYDCGLHSHETYYKRLDCVLSFVEQGDSGLDQKVLRNNVIKVLDKENDYYSESVNRFISASTIISTKPLKSTFGDQPNFWRAFVVSDKSKSTSDGRKYRGS
jgi:hypothetical protein